MATNPNLYRLNEGMDVIGTDGKKLGKIDKVVVGESTREARFFTIEKGLIFQKDYLVPREAIQRVEQDRAVVSITKDQIERLPQYEGKAPTAEEVRRAYDVVGGRRGEAFLFSELPGREREERLRTPYVVPTEERYNVLGREERERQGYRTEWTYEPYLDRR